MTILSKQVTDAAVKMQVSNQCCGERAMSVCDVRHTHLHVFLKFGNKGLVLASFWTRILDKNLACAIFGWKILSRMVQFVVQIQKPGQPSFCWTENWTVLKQVDQQKLESLLNLNDQMNKQMNDQIVALA